jgi:MarR family transcriptional regulator, organic hydroperoxide resistance regulator
MAPCHAHHAIQLQPQPFPDVASQAAVRPPSRASTRTLAEFEEVARLIAQARRKVWNAVARILAAEEEAVLGWAVVAVLSRLGPQSQRDLADTIGQHAAGISRQLAELDRAGLTTRTEDASDHRRRLVALTPKGRRWHGRWRPKVLRVVRDVLGVLDEAERRALTSSLLKVLALPPGPGRGATRRTRRGIRSRKAASRARS